MEKQFDAVEVAKIYETSNYKQFTLKKGNREINQRHVETLAKKITEKDLRIPIEVDSNLGIVDGQHRFFAYQKLNKKIRFFITPSVVEVKDIQTQNNVKMNWKIEDYMKSQIQLNNVHYITLKNLLDEFQLGLTEALLVFGVSKPTFREGGFKITDINKAKEIITKTNKILVNWEKSIDFKLKCGIILFIKENPNADISTLIQRMVKYPSKYYNCTKVREYVEMLKELYNYNTNVKNRI